MNRNIFSVITALLFSACSVAQKTTLSIAINSGLFAFHGAGAEKNSMIISSYGPQSDANYTNNPFGSQAALGYGISWTLQHIASNRVIFGTDLGFEVLRSKVTITDVDVIPFDIGFTEHYTATGKTHLDNRFVNLNLFGGYRLIKGKVDVDLCGGFDLGWRINAKEKGSARASNNTSYTTSLVRPGPHFDLRPRFQLAVTHKRAGAYAGYAFGLTNLNKGYIAPGSHSIYSSLLRFGLTYQFAQSSRLKH